MPGIAGNGRTMRKSGPNKISSFIRSNESQIVVWHPGWLETFARVSVGAGHEGVGAGRGVVHVKRGIVHDVPA